MRFEKWQALGNDYVILERGGASLGADAGAGAAASATRISGSAPTGCCCSRAARTRSSSPSCGSSTPTAPRPSSPATAPARRSSTCAATAGPTPTPSRSGPPPGRSRRRSPPSAPARSRWAAPRPRRRTFPRAARTGGGRWCAGGRAWDFQHVSIGNPQCAIVVEEGLEELDLAAIGPDIEADELFPNRTNVSFLQHRREHGSGRGSSSAGWGRRSPPGPAPAAPR